MNFKKDYVLINKLLNASAAIVTVAMLLLALFLLLRSSRCFGQDTLTAQDSMVLLPKQLVVYMVQDLVQADSDRLELRMVNEQYELQSGYIRVQDSMIVQYRAAADSLMDVASDCEDENNEIRKGMKENEEKMKGLQGQRNIAVILTVIMIVLTILTQ